MSKRNRKDKPANERRGFLRTGGLGVLAVALAGLMGREAEAALKAKLGSAMRAITSSTSSRAMPICLVVCTPLGGASPAQMQSAPMKQMR